MSNEKCIPNPGGENIFEKMSTGLGKWWGLRSGQKYGVEKPVRKRQCFENVSGTAGIVGFRRKRGFSGLAGGGGVGGWWKGGFEGQNWLDRWRCKFTIKTGVFEWRSQKWSNFPNRKQIHSPSKKKQQYFRRGVAKIEKCERHAGREAKKKNEPRATGEPFRFVEHP